MSSYSTPIYTLRNCQPSNAGDGANTPSTTLQNRMGVVNTAALAA